MKTTQILLCALLLLSGCRKSENPNTTEEKSIKIDSLLLELQKEKARGDSLQSYLEVQDSIKNAYPLFFGKKYDGIENPEDFIRAQLKNRPELIPMSPVLGGTMQFRKIDLISEKWLLAIYDDGHVQGKAIVEYSLQPDGSMKYTIIATQDN